MRRVMRWAVPALLFLGLLLAATTVGAISVGDSFYDGTFTCEVLTVSPSITCALTGWYGAAQPNMVVPSMVMRSYDGVTFLVTEIADGAFQGDTILTSVNFISANNLLRIGNSAFAGSSLSGSLHLNMLSLQTIGDSAFAGCNYTGSLRMTDNTILTTIGNNAFANNSFTFLDLQNMPQLATIGDNAFANNSHSGTLYLDNLSGLQSIGSNAFAGNPGITRVDFPPAAFTLGSTVFADSSTLNDLRFFATTPPVCAADSFSGVAAVGTITYQYPPTSEAAYETALRAGGLPVGWLHPLLGVSATERLSDIAVELTLYSDRDNCALYYAVVPAGDPAPTVDTSGAGLPISTTAQPFSYDTLVAGAWDFYFAVKDSGGKISLEPLKITVPAYAAPTLTAGTVTRLDDENATVTLSASRNNCGVYWAAVPAGDPAPTVDTTTPTGLYVGTAAANLTFSSLPAGAVDLYLWVRDSTGKLSDTALVVTVPAHTEQYTYQTVTDSGSGIAVDGWFLSPATITATANQLHAAGTCAACDEIRALQGSVGTIVVWDIASSQHREDAVTVRIPVGSTYEGMALSVLHCNGGVLETRTLTVVNGRVEGTFASLSPYAVLRPAAGPTVGPTAGPTAGPTSTPEPVPATGDDGNIRIYLVLLCAAIVALA